MLNSGDAKGLPASECRHAVEHAYTVRDFGCLRTNASRPQAIARERLETVHQVFDKRTPVVAAALLPFGASAFGDRCNRLVAPAVFSGQGVAPSRGGIEGCAPRTAITAWACFVSYAPSPPTISIGTSAGIWSSRSGSTPASSTS